MQEAVNEPWAADNKIVDDRLDNNADDLVEKARKEVEARVTRGESADKMVDAISKELGVDEIKILGTLDSVTCSLCGSMDGKILPRTQLEQGISEPPFHPNCRCTTVPYDEDWDYKGQRIAKDDNGNDYYVPEDMSYEEWKREFVGDKKLKANVKSELSGTENAEVGRAPKLANSGKSSELLRKSKNTGDFEEYPVLLELKTVKKLAAKYGVDANGLKFKIRRDKELKRIPILGRADKKRIGQIELYPNAFTSEEQLVKTLLHERHHVLQLRKYGKEYCDNNYSLMEKQAYRAEELFYSIVKKRTGK